MADFTVLSRAFDLPGLAARNLSGISRWHGLSNRFDGMIRVNPLSANKYNKNAIRQLMSPVEPKKKRPIGFASWKEKYP